ncbi:MAG: ornithine carbamoyltransferase [Caldisphaera sp.]|jgi:ornithine carbamoyltransferase|uniref:ornithine carbamoyltransferase n=1 Tax=Caldisphaera sp. TaxID=2060322 RepID=UPI00397B9174
MSIKELKGKDMLCLKDFTSEQVKYLIDLGLDLKRRYHAGERILNTLNGKSIAMIFEKPSTRTRVSLEVAAYQLGAQPITLGWNELQLGRGEPIKDTARVLSRFVNGITARVKNHNDLIELAKYADIPVINALSDLSHPMQVIADYMTIYEKKGRFKGLKLAFIGDGSDNMVHSLMIAASQLGIDFYLGSPKDLKPNDEIFKAAKGFAEINGSNIVITEDPLEAADKADIIYTDVFVSMGQEDIAEAKKKLLKPYQVNVKLMEKANNNAIFLHCLPAHRGEEVTDDVIEGPWSVVWDEAENRLHSEKAILTSLIP